MYSVLLSLSAGVATTFFFGWIFGGPGVKIGYGIVPGLVVMIGLWIYIGRKISKKLQLLMARFQEAVQPRGMVKPEKGRVEGAIKILEEGYQYSRWNLFVRGQLDGHIGMAHFVNKRFDDAEQYLETAMGRHWVAKSMLGVLYFKKKKYSEMKRVFEKTLKWTKKESFLWNLYAYCLWKSGDRDGAIDVLSRGLEILSGDARIETNKLALQNRKKMKMRGWNEMWYQYHLDTPPQPKMQLDRRGMYRGR